MFPALEVLAGDMRVRKIKYSAFMPGSSEIRCATQGPRHRHGAHCRHSNECLLQVDHHDAMLLDYKVTMLYGREKMPP